ncbi:MAG: DUF928 domain-containing protein [Cyanobacteria bacterium SBLK]|nr:DUF928 domain-containing protein [Cyanobacteria bacterium SBLK]
MHFLKSRLFSSLGLAAGAALLTGFSGAFVTSGVLAQSIPSQWSNANFTPPANLGAPDRTQAGGTRNGGGLELAALVPDSNFGVTAADNTSVFIYLPSARDVSQMRELKFELVDESDRVVHEADYQVSGGEGILRLVIPETNEEGEDLLVEGQNYYWIVTMYDETDETLALESWIRRVSVSEELTAQLSGKSAREQARILADRSIWYGALNQLALAYQENPQDEAIAQDWQKLLKAAGLGSFSRLSANAFLVPETVTSNVF